MNLEKKQLERKTLTEECWIDLGDGLEIRIDYPTRGQEAEYRRLDSYWFHQVTIESMDHSLNYYLRSVCKAVRGLTVGGKEAVLEVVHGLATKIVFDGGSVEFVEFLAGQNLWDKLLVEARKKLSYDDLDKKKLPSQPSSIETESSKETDQNLEKV